MKKILVCSICALILAGCTDARVKVSNENQVIATVGNKQITNKQFSEALSTYKYDATLDVIKQSLYDEYVPVNDEVNKLVDEKISEAKAKTEKANVSWEDSLKNFNTTEEEYRTKVILPAVRSELLAKKYVNENFEKYVTKFGLIKFNILEAKNDESAEKAIEAIKNGKTFEEAASEFGITTHYTGKTQITFADSSLIPATLYKEIASSQTNDPVKVNTEGIYVYQLVSKDPTQFKDEAMREMLNSPLVITDSLTHYISDKKIEIFDIDVYKGFEKNYKSAIKNNLK